MGGVKASSIFGRAHAACYVGRVMGAGDDTIPCPACGGAGGGPFGPAGSAWDDESYVCPRCKGRGFLSADDLVARPGLAKAADTQLERAKKERKATG